MCYFVLFSVSAESKKKAPKVLIIKAFKGFSLEVPPRFELGNNGFADRGLTTWLWYHIKLKSKTANLFLKVLCSLLYYMRKTSAYNKMERMTRLELATSTLARWRSTR